jgi:hypothetical protein
MEERYQKLPETNNEEAFETARKRQDEYRQGLIEQIKEN